MLMSNTLFSIIDEQWKAKLMTLLRLLSPGSILEPHCSVGMMSCFAL